MLVLRKIRLRIRSLFESSRVDQELDAELRDHLERQIQLHLAAGLSPADARNAALREFGNVAFIQEECRDMRRVNVIEDLLRDLRYALHSMRRTPGETAVAALSLALAIGANTAIFSLVEAVLFRTLPLAAPTELYFIAHGSSEGTSTSSNYPFLERVRDRGDVFGGVTAYSIGTFKVSSDGIMEQVRGQFVSGNYHALLGVPLALGRGFASEEDRAAASSPFAVISDSYWSRRFGRSPEVLGRTLDVGGHIVTIVGVTAPGFEGLDPGRPVDVTLPLFMRVLDKPGFLIMHDGWTSMPLIARLKPGVTEAQASAATDATLQQYLSEPENQWARIQTPDAFRVARLLPASQGSATLRTQYSTALAVLMVMVGIVLLIACINVANLLLVRSTARAKEFAVRLSLGASRGRLIRQLLTECTLLALCGGALGFLLAGWGTRIVVALFGEGRTPIMLDVQPNTTALLFTALVSLVTGLAFGVVPALRATQVEPTPTLKAGGTATQRGSRLTGRKVLVGGQIALCTVLLFVSGLFVHTLQNLTAIDSGFKKENVLLFALDTSGTPFPSERLPQLCADLVQRLSSRPGVLSGSCSTMSPVDTVVEFRGLNMPHLPRTPEARGVFVNVVTPEYFQTMGIRLLRGRGITPQDTATSGKVAVVNETMARFYFDSADPIGRTISFMSAPNDTIMIVGLVQDARQQLREAPPRMVYTALPQIHEPTSFLTVAVRTAVNPAFLAGSVRSEVRALSKDVAVTYVRTMEQQIGGALVRERLLALLSTAFGGLALLLACIGVYGVISYDVTRRTREIGIRLALGADRAAVLTAMLRQTAVVALVGVAAGLLVAPLVADVVSRFLFGLTPRDPVTLGTAAGILVITAILAGYFPARRASRVDPAVTLRAE